MTPSAWQGFASTPAFTPLNTPYASALATGNVSGSGFNDLVVGANGSATGQDELFVNQGNSSNGWKGFSATGTPIGSAGAVTTSLALGDVNGADTSASSSATRPVATSCTSATAPPPARSRSTRR